MSGRSYPHIVDRAHLAILKARPGGGELAGDRLRHQDLALEAPEKFDVIQRD